MFSVGEALRRARLEQGLDFATLAARTKISARYLEAIESDDRDALPSGFFYKSFVHQYARALSLDTREIDAEARSYPERGCSTAFARAGTRLCPKPGAYNGGASLPQARAVRDARHFCRFGLSDWRLFGGLHVVARPARDRNGQGDDAGQVRVCAAACQCHAPAGDSAGKRGSSGAANSPANPPPSEAPQATGSKVLLDLVAREVTWLSVSSDGKPVFSGLLHAQREQDRGRREDRQDSRWQRGRPGSALEWQAAPLLGERGQVLIVVFTPDNFQIFAPPKESD